MLWTVVWLSVLSSDYQLIDSVTTASDLSGYTRGLSAVAFDPAAPAWADGFELHLRSQLVANKQISDKWGTYLGWGTSWLTPYAGYEIYHVPGQDRQRTIVGIASKLGRRLSVGIAYRRFVSKNPLVNGVQSVDVGFFSEVSKWLSGAFTIEAINSPHIGQRTYKPRLRSGLSIRPWFGQPWLTIGGEILIETVAREYNHSRFVLDIGSEGLHFVTTYAPKQKQLFFGAALSWFGLETRFSAAPAWTNTIAHERSWEDASLAVTLRTKPEETAIHPSKRVIEFVLEDKLETKSTGLFDEVPAISTIIWQLSTLVHETSVDRVVLHIGKLNVGLATVDNLRQTITGLRQAGKQVVARIANIDDKSYMVAAAANEIVLDAAGVLQLDGFAVEVLYFAEVLEKLGIRFESVEVGKYKSAMDFLTRKNARPEDLEVRQEILRQAMKHLVQVLREDRKISEKEISDIIKQGIFTADEALRRGLVDTLLSEKEDNLSSRHAQYRGVRFESLRHHPSRRWSQLPTVAVIPVLGTIVMNADDNPLPGSTAAAQEIIEIVQEVHNDDDVVGAVVWINSGGGDVYASEKIWRAFSQLAQVKPLIVVLGDVAASGGYYVATAGTRIFAQANTLTGSIGIFSMKADLSALFEKVGIHTQVYKEGENADRNSFSHAWREADKEKIRKLLEKYYDLFLERVAQGRDLKKADVEKLAGGRVYTGSRALELGLVDQLGGLTQAVHLVLELAQVDTGSDFELSMPSQPWAVSTAIENLFHAEESLVQKWQSTLEQVHAFDGLPLAIMPISYEVQP